MFDIQNRRYTGCKYKLLDKISEIIKDKCKGDVFCDIFAGTGVVAAKMLPFMKKVIINDFLYSNEIIYNGFFLQEEYNQKTINECLKEFDSIDIKKVTDNYVSFNFGGKYFSYNDALIIGEIRERIEKMKNTINKKEYCILLASLLYSFDKIANTVGHYDAFIKKENIEDKFKFELISPIKCDTEIEIYREDSNQLCKKISADIVYIDPPYNSRQYSRFYHIWENITTWKKPELYGTALKPKEENMSVYCRVGAKRVFENLINDLNCKYIIVSYNNTYNSKSSSSKNKIELNDIEEILTNKGNIIKNEIPFNCFNAGKTEFDNHKEFLYLVEIK